MKKRRGFGVFSGWTAAAVLVTSVGCNDFGPTAPSSLPSRTLYTPPSLPPGGNSVPAGVAGVAGVYSQEITTERSGTATVRLSWPNADVSLELYLTSGDCTDAASLLARSCNILGYARPGNPPTMLSAAVTHDTKYLVWVLNPDPISQPITLDIDVQ
jgi:hypothetical protein